MSAILDLSAFERLGQIHMSSTYVSDWDRGIVMIRGGKLVIDFSVIDTNNSRGIDGTGSSGEG